jgi:hypothetical protein
MPDIEIQAAYATYQCRHIFTDGHRCGSKCLRNQDFCYYHHTTRRPLPKTELAGRQARIDRREAREAAFDLPHPEDRSAIQQGIGQVLRRIAANEIDSRRAGLLLYGLQIASLNLPKAVPAAEPVETVEDIIQDPEWGPLAPETAYQAPERVKGAAELLLEEWERGNPRPATFEDDFREDFDDPARPRKPINPDDLPYDNIPRIQAVASPLDPEPWTLDPVLLLRPQQHLQPDISDPARLAVVHGDRLDRPSAHQQQVQRLGVIQRLPPTQPKRHLPLFGFAGRELAHSLPGANAVGVLLVVELDIRLGAVGELVPHDQAASP